MNKRWKLWLGLAVFLVAFAQWAAILAVAGRWYMETALEAAKAEGVHATLEEGMRARIASSYTGVERIEIDHAGTNSFDGSNPHVGFVSARVWAAQRADGNALHGQGYDYPGSYFLQVRDGWVHMPEGRLPEVIGFLMRLFHYDG